MAHDYPRFGGDRKFREGSVEQNAAMGYPTTCQCSSCSNDATHAVYVQVENFRDNDEVYNVCGYHVGMARRHNRFKQFLTWAKKKGKKK